MYKFGSSNISSSTLSVISLSIWFSAYLLTKGFIAVRMKPCKPDAEDMVVLSVAHQHCPSLRSPPQLLIAIRFSLPFSASRLLSHITDLSYSFCLAHFLLASQPKVIP